MVQPTKRWTAEGSEGEAVIRADLLTMLEKGLTNCVVVRARWTENGVIQGTTYTGFILEMHGQWLWCTAGHCIEEVREILEKKAAPGFTFQYFDKSNSHPLVPFRLDAALTDWYDKDGIDIGYIRLPAWYAEQLSGSGVIPIRPPDVFPPSAPDGLYVLVGLPAQFSDLVDVDGGLYAKTTPVILGLERHYDADDDRLCFTWTFPIATSKEGKLLEHVRGMSGGVIYLVLDGPQGIELAPIGIQSRTLVKGKKMFATSMLLLTHVLERAHPAA